MVGSESWVLYIGTGIIGDYLVSCPINTCRWERRPGIVSLIHANEGGTIPRGRPLKALEVNQGAREELKSLARSRSLPAGLVRRAEIVLLCADGLDNVPGTPSIPTSGNAGSDCVSPPLSTGP